ncbi:lantibiotic dehydratase [Amycolatopsis nivea]
MTATAGTDVLVPLGMTRWTLWRDAGLRAAGFPATSVLALCDEELANAADSATGPDGDAWYREAFEAGMARLSAAVRRVAADPAFREAVTWQNPALLRTCLDKAAAGEPRTVRGRNHELAIASYLQRYCLKNDTIGFFGPVGWARLDPGADTGLAAVPGPRLVSRRTAYFEHWAIAAAADAIARLPEVFPWLRPRRAVAARIAGSVLHVPFRDPAALPAGELRLLARCDGRRTVRDLAGDPPDPAAIAALLRLRERGAIRLDLRGALATWPERELAARIAEIPDETARVRAHALLDPLVRARDRLAEAGGDPGGLASAAADLATAFERATGTAAARRHGDVYAARTVVYEDTVRDVHVEVGRKVLDALAPPLALVLDSAAWFADRVADLVLAKAAAVLAATGLPALPLLQLVTAVLPELGSGSAAPRSPVVQEAAEELRLRWARVLALPADGPGPVRVSAESIAGRVAEEFPAGPPRWRGARWYSPDVLVSAADDAALARGDADFVLGEVHTAANTLRYRMFAEQHPDPAELRRAVEAGEPGGRIVLVPGIDAPQTTARMGVEPQLPSSTYVSLGDEAIAPPPGSAVLSVLDLEVVPDGGVPVVRHRPTGTRHDFLEVVGESLSVLVAGAFEPFAVRGSRPRIAVDRLVVGRAAWSFPAAELGWAFERDESRRYALARRWRREHRLPERAFARVPVERKPVAVDFRSVPLVNLLAKNVRRTAGAGDVTLTEMLPDLDRLWLRDAEGRRYTAELRMAAVRPDPAI